MQKREKKLTIHQKKSESMMWIDKRTSVRLGKHAHVKSHRN